MFAGARVPSGAYALRVHVAADLRARFGRYAGGALIEVPAGEYAYVGSAMSARGSTALARRLLRHATRSGERPPHAIRTDLLRACAAAGIPGAAPPRRKTLFWNIDYLLDDPRAEIVSVLAIRSPQNLEACLAGALLEQPGVAPLAPRLGAHDSRDAAHLARIPAQPGWWRALCAHLCACLSPQQVSDFWKKSDT